VAKYLRNTGLKRQSAGGKRYRTIQQKTPRYSFRSPRVPGRAEHAPLSARQKTIGKLLSLMPNRERYRSKYGDRGNGNIISFRERQKKIPSKPKNETTQSREEAQWLKPGKAKRRRNENSLTMAENLPTTEQLEEELKRERTKKEGNRLVRNIIFALITVSAAAVLVATLFLPILQIYGTSMTPTLTEGDIVVSVKGAQFERGDVISFYYNNKILVKRVIAFEGEYVNIGEDGTVYINNKAIEEPYLIGKAFGECDLKLPYQIPAGKIFVLGDHRDTSVDSRSSVMGCVSEEQIVGKIIMRVWPITRMGWL